MNLESFDKLTEVTPSICPVKDLINAPVTKSQIFIDLSLEPDIIYLLSLVIVTTVTLS
jgi:hypothetical protein